MSYINPISIPINNLIQETIPSYYFGTSRFTRGCCSIICGIAAAENAICAIGHAHILINDIDSVQNRNEFMEEFIYYSVSSLVYGLCTVNIFPGAPAIGTALLLIKTYLGKDSDHLKLYHERVSKKSIDLSTASYTHIDKLTRSVFEKLRQLPTHTWTFLGLLGASVIIYKIANRGLVSL